MKVAHSKNNLRLIISSMYNFVYMGKINIVIYPCGRERYYLYIRGINVLYDDVDEKKDIGFITKNTTVRKILLDDLYEAITLFNRTVRLVTECYSPDVEQQDIMSIERHKNEFLPEVQNLL